MTLPYGETVTAPHGVGELFAFTPRDPVDAAVVDEVWRADTYRLRVEHLLHSGAVLDVGACFGAFTVLALALGASDVTAVEPHPDNLIAFNATLCMNGYDSGHVMALPVALGQPGRARLEGSGPMARTVAAPGGMVETHDLATLIDLAARPSRYGWREVDVLKLDCEGAEIHALANATSRTLRRCRRIVAEVHGTGHDQPPGGGMLGKALLNVAETHHLEFVGHASRGGMLYAERYGPPPKEAE